MAPINESSRPQLGRSSNTQSSIDNLNGHELNKMNRILDDEYNTKQHTILDKSLGEVLNNTINFFGYSFNSYSEKLLEAEFTQKLYTTEYSFMNSIQKYLFALVLFIRDDENIIYLGILMIILSVLICFFNISRSYGISEIDTKP